MAVKAAVILLILGIAVLFRVGCQSSAIEESSEEKVPAVEIAKLHSKTGFSIHTITYDGKQYLMVSDVGKVPVIVFHKSLPTPPAANP